MKRAIALGAATCLLLMTVMISGGPHVFGASASGPEFRDVSGENHYNYCPSYIQTDADTRYIFYCRNPKSDIIVDSIYWRKAVRNGSTWVWGNQREALAKGIGWESVHVCDPEVRKGSFLVGNHTYQWAMFYLGCDQLDNNHNQIGVAFADSIEGPWTRWAGNPLIPFEGTANWGIGQPSATSVDGKGQLLLFYTRGDRAGTRIQYRLMDLSDMSKPQLGTEKNLFRDGLTDKDGSNAIFHNAGFAYDAATDRMYTVRERHPYEARDCTFISSELEVAYTAGGNIWNNSGSWIQDGLVNPDNTGKDRNHNAGFLTDPFGNLTGGSTDYQISYSVADSGNDYLWTYRIHTIGRRQLNAVGKLDDRNQGLFYTGSWSTSEDLGSDYHLGTAKRSSKAGSTVRLSFRGGAVEVYGSRSDAHGQFEISIDGLPATVVDTYNATTRKPELLYRTEGLSKGYHMLTITVTGRKNALSKGSTVELDYLVVDVSPQSFASPEASPSGGGSTSGIGSTPDAHSLQSGASSSGTSAALSDGGSGSGTNSAGSTSGRSDPSGTPGGSSQSLDSPDSDPAGSDGPDTPPASSDGSAAGAGTHGTASFPWRWILPPAILAVLLISTFLLIGYRKKAGR